MFQKENDTASVEAAYVKHNENKAGPYLQVGFFNPICPRREGIR